MSDHAHDAESARTGTEIEYWYNDRTGEVEVGPQSLATERIGPFATRAEAERALEIVAERAAEWRDEED
ncbi:MAG TPA: hypothetical protein VNR37_08790 [Microbacteriaceae bacterium]|nr:hypothetical protein [Microbacteriaceae bacterium]